VNTLGTRGDLLTAHEEIVRVSVVGVLRVKHGVEGTSIGGVTVKHVEVSVMFLSDETAESLLSLSRQILKRVLFDASFGKHLATCPKVDLDDRVGNLELLEGVLIVDDRELAGEARLDVRHHVDHELTDEIKHLEVMVLELHLHIETCELTQVAVRVGVFGTEYGTNLENALQVTTESHLLIELRALSEAAWLIEVHEVEHVGAAFRRATDKLR